MHGDDRLGNCITGAAALIAAIVEGVMGGKADTNAFRAQIDGLASAALTRVRALR